MIDQKDSVRVKESEQYGLGDNNAEDMTKCSPN
jgi:hypothetical protein